MPARLDILITAPFPLGDVTAQLTFPDQSVRRVVLRSGALQTDLPELPERLRLLHAPAPEGEAPLAAPSEVLRPEQRELRGDLVEAEELFERGIRIPESGTLRLQLIWGVHCHQTVTGPSLASKLGGEVERQAPRFLSAEHVRCAERVGMDESGMRPLAANGKTATFNSKTLLPIGSQRATFGQIIALAGDFYAYLDAASRKNNGSAWPEAPGWVEFLAGDYREPPLVEDSSAVVKDILATFQHELEQLMRGEKLSALPQLVEGNRVTDFPVRRYLALAGMNYCHFGAQPPDGSIQDEVNEAYRSYLYYHRRALAQAEVAGMSLVNQEAKFIEALVIEAFGCHFLTDLFASGHIRVPRRALGERFGIMRGGLGMAHSMHDEDNKLGLWCTTRVPQTPRVVWRAYGDAMLLKPEAEAHLAMIQEAVRRSAAEVFLRYCGVSDVPEAETGEALLPVALAAGTAPRSEDVLPFDLGSPDTEPPNHFPLYALVDSGKPKHPLIARRADDKALYTNSYYEQDGDSARRFSIPLAAKR
ncbi:MAG: hypothetical protein U1A78_20990 [Polyangia bacterium]